MITLRDHLSDSSSMGGASVRATDSPDSLPTGTVTFLLSDVEGSTRLWEADTEVAALAIARHYELLGSAIALHGGARPVEQGEGDSVVGAFARASDAVAAALAAQRAFAEEAWPEQRAVRIRIALHTGEAHLRDDENYFGPAIIRCARLRAIAHGGQTLLSSATRDLVADIGLDDLRLRDLGAHRLKDLGRPERVWQLCHPDLASDFPSLRSLDAMPNNLPVQLTSFVGRDAELVELADTLRVNRVVTLTGAGGCGKTRIALHAAADIVDRHADGTWWIELAPVSAPDLVAYAVASALGLREEEGRPLLDTLCEQLADLDILLVLDNCEQVLDASAQLVEDLLRAAPGLRVVATSREPLGIPGEVTWRVPSLDDDAGTRLFIARAEQVRSGFAPSNEETEVISGICRRLDGIPLAIELAAARTRMMRPERIAASLDDRFRLLTGGSRTVMPRQQTLETSVAWSHDLLDDTERVLFRRLSVFAGGFTLDAAEDVCADLLVDGYAVLDLLTRLVDKSLVQVDHGDADERYRLLDTIRLYARDRLVEAAESDTTRDRHLEFFVGFAERVEPQLAVASGPMWLARLEREHDNFRAALEWADSTASSERLLRLVTALTLFWELRGHLGAGGRWFARALRVDDGPSSTRARALWGAAHVALYGDDFETAAQRAPEALAMAETVGDEWALARALNTVGYLTMWDEPEKARAALGQSVELGRKIGDHWATADGLKMITVAWLMQEDHAGLSDSLEALRAEAEQLGNTFFSAWYHCCIGWVALRRGQLDTARAALHTSLEQCKMVGEPATGGVALALLAELETLTGDCDAAETRLGSFLQRAAAAGGGLGVPFALPVLAEINLGRGDPSGSRALIEPLVDQMRALGLPLLLSRALVVFGAALLALGEDDAARAALEEARDQALPIANPWLLAMADHHLGELARHQGDAGRAEDLHHEALARRVERGLCPGVAESLEALATLAADNESYAEATRLCGAAVALRTHLGFVRWPIELAANDEMLARAQHHLGEAAFAATWAEGEALSMHDAAAYASRARGERKRPSMGWASLTPTELEVVKLAAKGMTNPQIGERLFIGRGTVKTHLAHVFTKLGVMSRSELASEATRRGL